VGPFFLLHEKDLTSWLSCDKLWESANEQGGLVEINNKGGHVPVEQLTVFARDLQKHDMVKLPILTKKAIHSLAKSFESIVESLDAALGYQLPQSEILRVAMDKVGADLAEQLIWDAQKKVLAQNAVSDMEDDHVTMGDDT
jgi:hypothetical protein